jgi:hypothetical protein
MIRGRSGRSGRRRGRRRRGRRVGGGVRNCRDFGGGGLRRDLRVWLRSKIWTSETGLFGGCWEYWKWMVG